MTPEKKIAFTMRVEPSLRDAFLAACHANHRPAALVLRDYMREYLRKHAQGDLFVGERRSGAS